MVCLIKDAVGKMEQNLGGIQSISDYQHFSEEIEWNSQKPSQHPVSEFATNEHRK